jgi:hypothetical protein
MVVGDASMGLCLSCIANVVKQCGLPMMLNGFFQLCNRLTMKELRSDQGIPGNGRICVCHVVTCSGYEQM